MIETQADLRIAALLMIYHVLRLDFWNKLDQIVMSWHTAIQRHIEPAPICSGTLVVAHDSALSAPETVDVK